MPKVKKNIKKQSRKERRPNLSQYAGKWVAILGSKVIAHGDKLEDIASYVIRDSKDKVPMEKRPAAFKVPHKDEGPYILIF